MKDDIQNFTKEQLERIGSYNAVVFGKTAYEDQKAFQDKMNTLMLQQSENAVKASDLQLEVSRLILRPHRLYPTEVFYLASEGIYICRLILTESEPEPESESESDDNDDNQIILACGDTASQACDNFDYKWVHGERKNNV